MYITTYTAINYCQLRDKRTLTPNKMKEKLLQARNKLYEALPTDKVDAFELIQAINIHLKRLDNIIDECNELQKQK